MRFTIRTLLFVALLISCVLAIAGVQVSHRAEVASLRQEIDIAASKAERLGNANMLVRVLEHQENLTATDYQEIARTAFCMLLDCNKNVESWDVNDYARVHIAGHLLAYLGIDNTEDFMRHAAENPDWGIGDATWLNGTNHVEIAVSSSEYVVSDTEKIWNPDQD